MALRIVHDCVSSAFLTEVASNTCDRADAINGAPTGTLFTASRKYKRTALRPTIDRSLSTVNCQ